MNTSKIVWGMICLLIAGGLTFANLRLPPENLMFQIGDTNMPWVPPVVLAVIGIVLLATARSASRAEPEIEKVDEADPQKAAVNRRLENAAWGIFLIMLGGFLFIPDEMINGGWWPIGVGLIMLGLNGFRFLNGLRMSGFTTVLGLLSVIGGLLTLAGIENLEGATLLIILGLYLLAKPWFEQQRLFGKAEQA